MLTSCLCSRIQLQITCLCLASARESLAYISSIGCGCHLLWAMISVLWGLKYSLPEQINSRKSLVGCVFGEGHMFFCCPWPQFFSGLWWFPVLFPPCFQGLSGSCCKPHTRDKEEHGVLPQVPSSKTIVGGCWNVHFLFCSSLILTAIPKPLCGFFSLLALNFSFPWVSYRSLFPSCLSLPPALTWTAQSHKCSEHVNQACKSLLV